MKNNRLSFSIRQINPILIFLFLLFLPTQLGRHIFFDFSYISSVRIDYLSFVLYLTDLVGLTLISLNIQSIYLFIKKNSKIFLLLTLLFAINIFLSRIPLLAFYRFLKIAEILFIYVIVKESDINFKFISLSFLPGGVFELFLSILQFYFKSSLQGVFYFFGERYLTLASPDIAKATIQGVEILRPYGTFSHPNSLAGFYLLLYFYFLTTKPPGTYKPRGLMTSAKKPPRLNTLNTWSLVKYTSLLIFSLLILISFSKAAITTYLLLNIIYIFIKKRDCRFCSFSSSLLFGVASLIFLQASTDPLSLEKRLTLISNSLVIIKNNLITGVGLGHYLIYQAQFPIKYNYFFLQPVHNIFLLFLAEVGFLIFIFIFYLLIRYLKDNLRNISFAFCFFAFLITGIADHYWITLQQNWLLLPVIFALVLRK